MMTPQSPNKTLPVEADEPLIQPICSIFRRFLKRQGLKFTPERAEILNSVLSKPGVFEAEQLLDEMRHTGVRVSKATIYRTLKHLIEAKILTEVLLDSKQSHYQLSFGREPQGHLVCVESGKIIEFTDPKLQVIRDAVCKAHGFDPVSYRFVIYGVSPEARKAEQAEHAPSDEPSRAI
jgi:Fur family ferric uptake transcriptional regulator